MRRILLIVSYDGTNYHGWQIQDNGDTIEGELNKAIKRLTGETVEVIGASRTDAGVHGLCNRAVFDTESTVPAEKFAAALNSFLPDDIRVRESKEVDDNWHPRKCSTHKTYEYVIDVGEVADPRLRNYAWHMRGPLDAEAMKKAAGFFLGEHDFTSFCSVNGTALTNVRRIVNIRLEVLPRLSSGALAENDVVFENELCDVFKANCGSFLEKEVTDDRASVKSTGTTGRLVSGRIMLRITGTGFLYNMVRIIAGTLVHVGMGRFKPDDVKSMLEAMDRTVAGPTAPPQGLTLVEIEDV